MFLTPCAEIVTRAPFHDPAHGGQEHGETGVPERVAMQISGHRPGRF